MTFELTSNWMEFNFKNNSIQIQLKKMGFKSV
jgi:hypothetical protein